MGGLLAAEPLEIASLGLRLLRASAAVAAARPVELPSSWRGRTAEVIGGRMCAVARVLPRIEEAYDDSGRALLLYAGAVEDAQALARRAADLRAEADRLSALSTWSGPDPGDALRMTAARWEVQAAEMHDAAVRRCVAVLDEVAQSAPRVRAGVAGERFRADAAGSVWGQLTGLAGLAVNAGEALGGNRAARDELVSVAKESWRVWEPFVDLYQQLDDGRGGLAVGSAMGFLGGKGAIRPVRPSAGGTHGRVDDVDVARDEARQEAVMRHVMHVLGTVARPWRPGDATFGLFAHEAMNGHAVRQHVAKSLAFVRWRAHPQRSKTASSFPDARTAQNVLDHFVHERRRELEHLMTLPVGARWSGSVDVGRPVGYGYTAFDPDLRTTSAASASFLRVEGGIVLVTLYPKVTP
jgi:Bacterial CdiA-CT RNAse A domain